MILRDQYFLTCDKSLQKEKGKLSLKKMTKVSNDYFEAHGYPAENHERKINGVSNKAYTHKSNNECNELNCTGRICSRLWDIQCQRMA